MITMTQELARSIGQDAGDKSMRQAGRTAWNEDDWNAAVDAFNAAIDLMKVQEDR